MKVLLSIKQGKVKYTYQLADKLKRGRRTIYDWLKSYEGKGIEGYLIVSSRGRRKEKLSANEKQAIALKLQDPVTDIASYVELFYWVNHQFGKDIP